MNIYTDPETKLIGHALKNNDNIQLIKLEYFQAEKNRIIAKKILEQHKKDMTVDLLTVSTELPGTAHYISEVVSSAMSGDNMETIINMLDNRLFKRKVNALAQRIIDSKETEKNKLLGEIYDELNRIENNIQNDKYFDLKTKLGEKIETIEQRYHNYSKTRDRVTGLKSGYQTLDDIYDVFQKEYYIVLTARPKTGKTALMINIIANMAFANIKTGLFTLEMPADLVLDRMIANYTNISATNIRRGILKAADFHSLSEWTGRMMNTTILTDESHGLTKEQLMLKMRKMKKDGVKIIWIDYMEFIRDDSNTTMFEKMTNISFLMKKMAKKLQIPVVLIVQTGRNDQLRHTGNIEQDADVVLKLIESDDDNSTVTQNRKIDLQIKYNRNGPIGTIPMIFNGKITAFYEKAIDK